MLVGALGCGAYLLANFEDVCPDYLPPTEMSVTIDYPDFEVNNKLSRDELRTIYNEGRNTLAAWDVTGLTKTFVHHSVKSTLAHRSLLGKSCGTPQVSVALTLKSPVIYIASDLPEGSCEYRAVLNHEMAHVTTHKYHLKATQRKVQELLDSRFPESFVFKGQSKEDMSYRLNLLVSEELPQLLNDETVIGTKLQDALDNYEEYMRLANECKDSGG